MLTAPKAREGAAASACLRYVVVPGRFEKMSRHAAEFSWHISIDDRELSLPTIVITFDRKIIGCP